MISLKFEFHSIDVYLRVSYLFVCLSSRDPGLLLIGKGVIGKSKLELSLRIYKVAAAKTDGFYIFIGNRGYLISFEEDASIIP